MPQKDATVLRVSRVLLLILRFLNYFFGFILLVGLVGSFVFTDFATELFSKTDGSNPWLLPTLRLWLVLALPMVAANHILLSRLLDIVGTVRAGDPFVPDNAKRLRTIGWCMVGLQLLQPTFGVMAALMNAAGSNIAWEFSLGDTLTGWAAVLLLFVLARVFEEGIRLRADLETMI